MSADIKLGSRVYLTIAIAGDPGVIVGWDKRGKAIVDWYDLGITTTHPVDRLVLDESFTVSQRSFAFGAQAA